MTYIELLVDKISTAPPTYTC